MICDQDLISNLYGFILIMCNENACDTKLLIPFLLARVEALILLLHRSLQMVHQEVIPVDLEPMLLQMQLSVSARQITGSDIYFQVLITPVNSSNSKTRSLICFFGIFAISSPNAILSKTVIYRNSA